MDSTQIARTLQRVTEYREALEDRAISLKDRFNEAISFIDKLDDAQEREIVGEVLAESTTGNEVGFAVLEPMIVPGSETVYINGNVVDPGNYDVHGGLVIVPLGYVPPNATLTIDYTHRGDLADVTDVLYELPGYSPAELQADRAKYQTAVNWIAANFG